MDFGFIGAAGHPDYFPMAASNSYPPSQPSPRSDPPAEEASWLLTRTSNRGTSATAAAAASSSSSSSLPTSGKPLPPVPSAVKAAAAAAAAATTTTTIATTSSPLPSSLASRNASPRRASTSPPIAQQQFTPHPPTSPKHPSPRASMQQRSSLAGSPSAPPPLFIPEHLRQPTAGFASQHVTLPSGVSLASTLFFANQPQIQMKIILLGDAEVGKTSLWQCMRRGGEAIQLREHIATIAADHWQVDTVLTITPPVSLKMVFWDTAGQERFDSLVRAYTNQSQVALFVFDLTKQSTLERLERHWLPLVKQHAQRAQRIYVGNKSDESAKRFASRETIVQRLAVMNDSIADANYIETSCKTGENVAELFLRARNLFIETDEQAQGVMAGDTRTIHNLALRAESAAKVRLTFTQGTGGNGATTNGTGKASASSTCGSC